MTDTQHQRDIQAATNAVLDAMEHYATVGDYERVQVFYRGERIEDTGDVVVSRDTFTVQRDRPTTSSFAA